MPFELDANNPAHAVGHSVLDVDLGSSDRRMLVISGIAVPSWQIDSDELHQAQCRLNLRVMADNLEQSTVHVGLASIGNDDTEWVLAIDQARLETASSGELILVTNLAILGETSDIHRFGYQVVLTKRVVRSKIAGKITWPTRLFRPTSSSPSGVASNFRIVANFLETHTTPAIGIAGPSTTEVLTPATPGEIITLTTGEDTCVAEYHIIEPPKHRLLRVTIGLEGFLDPPIDDVICEPVSPGSNTFTLTPMDATRSGVDFVVIVAEGPH